MTETFLFVRLGEGEVYRNVVWKLQRCHDMVGGDFAPVFLWGRGDRPFYPQNRRHCPSVPYGGRI